MPGLATRIVQTGKSREVRGSVDDEALENSEKAKSFTSSTAQAVHLMRMFLLHGRGDDVYVYNRSRPH